MTLSCFRIIAVFCALLFSATTTPAIEFPAEASGRLVMQFDLSDRQETGETLLWIPYPLSDSRQSVTDVTIEGDFSESAVLSDREHSNTVLFAKWPAGAGKRTLSLSFTVSRREVAQRDLPEVEPSYDAKDLARYLKPTSLGPIDGRIKQLADEVTKDKTGILEKARAVYEWTSRFTFRNPDTKGCGEGDVCELLENPGGKCADIHSVFVAVARAAGVPAREVFGIRQAKVDGLDITGWQHCWAEFFLPGFGWVAVDPADVRKMMLKRGLAPEDSVPEDLLAYYWGGLDPLRVKLSVGRDLVLNPPQKGAPINYLMYPFAQIGGVTLDWLDPASFRYSVTYRTL